MAEGRNYVDCGALVKNSLWCGALAAGSYMSDGGLGALLAGKLWQEIVCAGHM